MNKFNITNKKLSLYRFSIPFNQPINFKNEHLSSREGLWLIEHQENGNDYIGEISPLPGFSDETIEQCEQLLQQILQVNTQAADNNAAILTLLPSVSFGLFCLQQQIPWQSITTGSPQSIPLLQGEFSGIVQRYRLLNCPNIVKLKVARKTLEQDIYILKALIQINPKISFRLDANQQWTAKQYRHFLEKIDKQHIDYIEEPTILLKDNLAISEQFKVSIGLDESLLNDKVLPIHHCIHTLVIKPTLIGGQPRINKLLSHAQQHQLNISISSSFESPIAIKQLHHLAEKWKNKYNLTVHLGLDTLHAFQQDEAADLSDHSTDLNKLLTKATCIWHC